jgi:hypothetical protein
MSRVIFPDSEVRDRGPEIRFRVSGLGIQNWDAEVREQRSEVRGPRSERGKRKEEIGIRAEGSRFKAQGSRVKANSMLYALCTMKKPLINK